MIHDGVCCGHAEWVMMYCRIQWKLVLLWLSLESSTAGDQILRLALWKTLLVRSAPPPPPPLPPTAHKMHKTHTAVVLLLNWSDAPCNCRTSIGQLLLAPCIDGFLRNLAPSRQINPICLHEALLESGPQTSAVPVTTSLVGYPSQLDMLIWPLVAYAIHQSAESKSAKRCMHWRARQAEEYLLCRLESRASPRAESGPKLKAVCMSNAEDACQEKLQGDV